jgi:hypothetical protein
MPDDRINALTAAFAAEPATVAEMHAPETLASLRPPPARSTAGELTAKLTAARAKSAAIERALESARSEAGKIDARFNQAARAEAEAEIRKAGEVAALPLMADLREIAADVEAQRAIHHPEVRRREARFAIEPEKEAAHRTAAVLRAQGASAAGLQALALVAAADRSIALAVVVADEVARRSDLGPGDRRAILRLLPEPPAPPELETIDAVREIGRAADWNVREFVRPGSTRSERMASGFNRGTK